MAGHNASWRNSADFLGVLVGMSMVCHGMFFLREWLVIGAGVLVGTVGAVWTVRAMGTMGAVRHGSVVGVRGLRGNSRGIADTLWMLPFLGMILLSLMGLLRPVIGYLAWFEGWRWLLYACVFWWSRELTRRGQWPRLRRWLLVWGVLFVVSGFMPGLDRFWPQAVTEVSRLGSWIGYPNVAGAMAGGLFFLALNWGGEKWEAGGKWEGRDGMLEAGGKREGSDGRLEAGGEREAGESWEVSGGSWKVGCFLLLVFAFLFAGVWASGSRGVFICWGVVFLLWVCLVGVIPGKRHLLICALGGVVAGVLLGVVPGVVLEVFRGTGAWGAGEGWTRLLVWDNTSLAARWCYAGDALQLAALNSFWPAAGGWHAYPLVYDTAYYSSDPHSSLLSVLLNQGGMGVVLVVLWGMVGLRQSARANGQVSVVLALVFLVAHSLIDADLAFGCVGFLFWILAGVASFSCSREYHIRE